AKLFTILVFVLLLAYGAIGFYFLPLATFQGELTRMGLVPEKTFGWRKAQPAIDVRWFTQSSMQEADVLVIGDSFSDPRVWQTELVKRGLKVRTEPWDSIRNICVDFMPWLKAQGFRGRYLVLEIIERNIADGLGKSVACQTMQTHSSVNVDTPRNPPPDSFDADLQDWSGRFSVGIQTALNYRKYERLSSTAGYKIANLPNGVKVARVPNGCQLFSHTGCEDSLFLGEDRPEDLDQVNLDHIKTLEARLYGISVIWAFVPNKSTTYLYPDKHFWNEAEQRFGAPNLLRMTQQAIKEKIVDLYPANNTHFSPTGYLMVGQEIYKAMQQEQHQDADLR
ncbi:MAG: hypothetical protein AAB278_07215, partial [Pseudomonadota bacterium]